MRILRSSITLISRKCASLSSTMTTSLPPLHPESQAVVDIINAAGTKPLYDMTLQDARITGQKSAHVFAGKYNFKGERNEYTVPCASSNDTIPVYVYLPQNVSRDCPILVYYHGGGFVTGSRKDVDVTCKMLTDEGEFITVNVDYRLAPEHKFPVPFNDAECAAKWTLSNRQLIGGSVRSKVGVAGDSAGGSLSVYVASQVKDLAFQILVYPGLNDNENSESRKQYAEGPILTSELMNWFSKQLQSDTSLQHEAQKTLGRHQDYYRHLPPALFIVAECDPLRDDSYEYQKMLTAAGVPNELHLVKGAIHAFYTWPAAFRELTKEAYSKTMDFVNRHGRGVNSPI